MSAAEDIIYHPYKRGTHPLQHEMDKIIEASHYHNTNIDHLIYDGEVSAEAKAAVIAETERHCAVYMALWEVILMLEMGMKNGTKVLGEKKPLSIDDFRRMAKKHFDDTLNLMRSQGWIDF
jgi:hypothetical protein